MNDNIEIPLGKRTLVYRFFEMLPGFMSFGLIILLIALSILNPLLAAVFLLLVVLTTFIKAFGIAVRTIQGYGRPKKAQSVNWQKRLQDLAHVQKHHTLPRTQTKGWRSSVHTEHLRSVQATPESYPLVSDLYNAVIIPIYNESLEVLEPTIETVLKSSFDSKKVILIITYEGRDGAQSEEASLALAKKYVSSFFHIDAIKHPLTQDEVRGKGGNITFAGRFLANWLKKSDIAPEKVIVTTLDCDNRPHREYLASVTYEYIVHTNRYRLSFQPISLFLNNIWDAPAPMRVIATGNSFWNLICSMRPHTLRNFAAHSQGMQALEAMDFWTVRSVVEDGHQYWRSYFFFNGRYSVIPIYVPIYQDAVLAQTYAKTLKAQFMQLRRWAYGASDVAYVATQLIKKRRKVPLVSALAHFVRLLDSHVTLASVPLLVAFGGWVPLFLNQDASRSIVAHELPEVISQIQRIALVGIFITVFLTFKMLPPRPERYKRRRSFFMLAQWLLMPVTAIVYSSLAAYNAQTHLLLGKYLDEFDTTEKIVKSDK